MFCTAIPRCLAIISVIAVANGLDLDAGEPAVIPDAASLVADTLSCPRCCHTSFLQPLNRAYHWWWMVISDCEPHRSSDVVVSETSSIDLDLNACINITARGSDMSETIHSNRPAR